ncbi:hypothetical protein CFOL_v3_10698 [Cephalotus follicularis]|uniref:Uncharacterized protein n=1 Tax=Cephalotus follicularis TaxID=3775 RepID=A0A1Q3BH10_CEPFO|nr:hypothetical protein CFOL_v3_10698 [Cephalotus follicularis]
MLFFLNGKKKSISNFCKLLKEYEEFSGQLINRDKSCFVVSSTMTRQRTDLISAWSNFEGQSLPIKYLGIPLFKGRARALYFEDLVERISSRIQNWKCKLLSFGGKLTLIKSVLSSMPIHVFSLLKVPKMVSNRIQKLFANFLWNSQGNSRLHWIGWHQICHPFAEGGLGIRNMNTVMQSLQSKFAWRFTQGDSLWVQIVRSKYGTCHRILQKGIRPSSSHC